MELKPCPFCGGEAHIDVSVPRRHNASALVYVRCEACKACGQYVPANKANGWNEGARGKAADAWNRRAERTCNVESSHVEHEMGCGSHLEVELSCGHAFTWCDCTPPDFCPDCGARVVEQ